MDRVCKTICSPFPPKPTWPECTPNLVESRSQVNFEVRCSAVEQGQVEGRVKHIDAKHIDGFDKQWAFGE